MTALEAPLLSSLLEQIDDDVLDRATDEELELIIRAARAEIEELDATWALQPRQLTAEKIVREGEAFELLYGGAAGGGKSEWILYHFYNLALDFPGFHGLILRRTFPELRRSMIMRSWERFDTDLCKYYSSEHIWRFANGSTIEFGYCEADRDVYQYQSAEYDAIGWDELTQFPTDFPYTYLMSRCRTTVDKRARGLRPHIIAGTNPGGIGGAWVKARFVDVCQPERIYNATVLVRGKEVVVPRVFIPAFLADNAYLGDEYAIALANLPEDIRAALQDGSWDVIEGQYFREWDRQIHVIDPFEIPRFWRRWRGLDYGFTNPACCLWFATNEDGDVFVYREFYRTELVPRDQAKRILAMSVYGDQEGQLTGAERVDYTVADPSIWTRTGAGPPIAQQYSDEGLVCRKANNARVDGWAMVRQYLAIDRRTKRPKLYIFSTCRNLIRTLPMLVHDDVKPEDLDTRGEDHAADALRYGLMSRPLKTKRPDSSAPRDADERVWQRVRSRRHRKRQSGTTGSPWGTLT